jgi:universal stress protein F
MNVRRILVGLDGSPREPLVLAAAQDLGLRYDAALLLVRAIGLPLEIPAEAWRDPRGLLKAHLEKVARDGLERRARSLCEALRSSCTIEVVLATPWEALCLCAEARKVDMIVIGSHGYGGLDRILGTTAERVVNHAPCSVFVARASEVVEVGVQAESPRSTSLEN